MADRTFSIVTAAGDSLQLNTGPTGDFALLVGVWGIGMPPVEPRYLEGAMNGGLYRGERYGMRSIDLPVWIGGSNRADMESKIRMLAQYVDPTNGLPKLVATYADGTVYQLPFVYVSGLEGDGTDSRMTHAQYTLSILCPQPFWESRDATQFSVPAASAIIGLLPDLAALQLMSSQQLGSVSINNPGDVETPITWIITGPGGPASATLNGRGWTYNATIAVSHSVTISRNQSGVSVLTDAGTSAYANMSPAPKFFNLPPGDSVINLAFTGATGASSFAGFFRPRRKVVY